ncbi:Hypothetical predicted protein [Prunus dulcis]|uniref:Uncharacterized protein n=1 Tax=Prunus dulcis TaxID=3755 RepID=A0A5E4GH04_PRUDU|nr:Hypothetical predicted protein [Prunus dulcis]
MEIGQPSYRKLGFDARANDEQVALNLDLIESFVTRPTCASLLTSNVLPSTTTLVCCPVPSDLEIRSCPRFQWQPRTLPKVPSAQPGKDYMKSKVCRLGTYQLRDSNGKSLPHTWNANHLKYYYE